MHATQQYKLTVTDLFSVNAGMVCGATAVVSILDGDDEIDRVKFSGKVGPGGSGYSRMYSGRPGLKAALASGPGAISMVSV